MELETSPQNTSLIGLGVKNGLIMAGVSVAVFFISYLILPALMSSMLFNVISMLIGIGLAVFLSLEMRKQIGGFWTFRQALQGIFVMFLTSGIVYKIILLIYAKIDKNFVPKMKEVSEQAYNAMMEKFGATGPEAEKGLQKALDGIEKQFNPGFGDLLMAIGIMVIFCFIGALIFGAIFKKEHPIMPTIGVED